MIYLLFTRPNLTQLVQVLSQFMLAPKQPHMEAAFRILRYLKATPGKGIFLPLEYSLEWRGFSDSDWGTCLNTQRPLTSYCVSLR